MDVVFQQEQTKFFHIVSFAGAKVVIFFEICKDLFLIPCIGWHFAAQYTEAYPLKSFWDCAHARGGRAYIPLIYIERKETSENTTVRST